MSDITDQATSSSAISLMQIYDVLICMYAEMNADDAAELAELHRAGRLRSNLPFLEIEEQ